MGHRCAGRSRKSSATAEARAAINRRRRAWRDLRRAGLLEPDGTYVLRNPTSEYRGTYTRDGQTLTIVSDKNVRAVLTLDAEGFVDNGGIRWTRR